MSELLYFLYFTFLISHTLNSLSKDFHIYITSFFLFNENTSANVFLSPYPLIYAAYLCQSYGILIGVSSSFLFILLVKTWDGPYCQRRKSPIASVGPLEVKASFNPCLAKGPQRFQPHTTSCPLHSWELSLLSNTEKKLFANREALFIYEQLKFIARSYLHCATSDFL